MALYCARCADSEHHFRSERLLHCNVLGCTCSARKPIGFHGKRQRERALNAARQERKHLVVFEPVTHRSRYRIEKRTGRLFISNGKGEWKPFVDTPFIVPQGSEWGTRIIMEELNA